MGVPQQMSYPHRHINRVFMQYRKTTKKAASSVKRKTVSPKSQNVAELRELLQQAAGALIALDQMIDRMIADKR